MNYGYLGIDVSKGYSDMVLHDEHYGRLCKPVQFDDTPTGHQRCLNWIQKCMKTFSIETLYAGLESTGGFEDNWYSFFIQAGCELSIHVTRLNPLRVKRGAQANLSIQSTDVLSADYIAEYIHRYNDKVEWDVVQTRYRSYRSFDKHIDLLVKQNSQQKTQFKQLLYSSYPELLPYCRQSIPNWILELIKAYPSPKRLAQAPPEEVAGIRYITLKKAHALIDAARDSVSGQADPLDEHLLTSIATQLQSMTRKVASLKATLIETCRGREVELLATITGIADYSAASLMIQIEDIRRFASASKLSGYFGLHPKLKESGDGKMVSKMSKQGRSQVRATLYLCASIAVIKDDHLKNIYARHREKGKTHKEALGVVMHKMIRIIWGVLTSGKAYNPQIDQKNRANNGSYQTTEEQAHNELHAKRREQGLDPLAPISRIAHKKRRAYLQSQVNNVEQMRDHEKRPEVKHIKKFNIPLEK